MSPYSITQQITFSYGHRLLDYDGKCAHLHGHNAVVEIVLAAPQLDTRGMVVDFSDIKRAMTDWIDRELDHRLLLRRDDPFVRLLSERGEPIVSLEENPTAEHLARVIYDAAKKMDFPIAEVKVWETPTQCAAYRPAL